MATTTFMLRSCLPLLLLITCLSTTVLSQKCDPRDRKVLLEIKKEFNSPSLGEAWDTRKDCCQWNNLACDVKTNRVNFFSFFGGLDLPRPTPIPPSFSKLPYLQQLYFQKVPNLTGPIPPSFVHLRRLLFFTISETNVSGPIPEFLTQLKRLVAITLAHNDLSGPIPSSLPRLKSLQGINLAGNRLSGPIPESFGTFSNLKLNDLDLSNNQLSGRIPASFGKLNLATMDLSWNKLEGDASMLFGSNKKTNQLVLSGNKFAFDLGKVGLPREMWKFVIDHNSIYGNLPKDLTELKILDELNVSHNYLCGEIPQGGNLKKFNASSYAHNKCLCGHPLPPCK